MNPWRNLRGLPKEMWVLFTTTLVNRAGTMALPFLVLYLTRARALSAAEASFAITVYGIGALITAPVAGRISDRLGALKVMKASLVISGLVLFAYPLAEDFIVILAITLCWAITSEAFRPANMALIADIVAPEQRKAAFALNRLAVNLGMSVGPAAGGILADKVSFPALFIVDGATSILAGAVLLLSRWNFAPHAHHDDAGRDGAAAGRAPRGVLSDYRLLYFLVAFMPALMVFFQTNAAMPLYVVRDLGITESIFGVLITINTGLIILFEVPLNAAMANWNDRAALVAGTLLTGAGFGAMVFARDPWGIAATVVVWTFGEMILFPASSAYVAEIAPAARRGEYMGYYQMSFSLAFALGPLAGAEILERAGATTLWVATFVCCFVSALMMSRVYLKRDEAGQERASA
jgi:predicted MFS family arabinose efflux permease